ncbi:MAG: NapC/NirT family cytochrome c [Calditrichia bacterium]
MSIKFPSSTKNWITLIGATIVAISLSMIVFLFSLTLLLGEHGTYLGLVTYILLPSVMIIGLIMIPLGMILKIRREKAGKEARDFGWPRVDLNDIHHRHAFFVFTIGTAIFLFLSAIGSYEAFHYTESTEFCGTLCHNVMIPEYTAYQNSPHAKVACVACHVGPGAGWYVRSKMSGLYQVYAVLANVYPKPIPTPIHNLRPAREVCEQCHWPQKFYAHKLRLETHYIPDEQNTRWDIRLIMKIGAEHSAHGLKEGIHWHINPDISVEYVALDKKREEIPWVRLTNKKTGEVQIFQDEENPIEPAQLDTLEIRTMDCIDCHNRPSHLYRPPAFFLNHAITAGAIPQELPEIKSVALELCGKEYETTEEAMQKIDEGIHAFYAENYPEIAEEKPEQIAQAIKGIQDEFKKNIFPEMKVRWDAYPNHIGHLEFNGCFRCHTDRHVSETGKTISKDCNQCHIINTQGTPDDMEVAMVGQSLEFKHPVDIDGAWREGLCTDCHTGLNP